MVILTGDAGIREIEERLAGVDGRSTVVVAVDGHSAAGKSTFARRLSVRLSAAVVSGDDFYRVMDPTERARLDPAEGADRYYDWERMLAEALAPLYGGRPARYRPYDWETNALGRRLVTVAPQPRVIVEGLFVSRPELNTMVDLTVLVMAEPDVRHQRQLDRADASDAWLQRWDAAERWYFNHVRPPGSFDVVINSTAAGERTPEP